MNEIEEPRPAPFHPALLLLIPALAAMHLHYWTKRHPTGTVLVIEGLAASAYLLLR